MPNDNLLALRHSAEHVLTQAMLKLYPGLKMAMGPATDEGFYFDFDLEAKINEEDFSKIEAAMQAIIDADLPITKKEISINEARELFKGNEYKQAWLDEIEKNGGKPTVYYTGEEFVDLCAGPHVKSTGAIKAFKLLKIAGAYWHGDENNKMLTRIYGTAFESKKELDEYLNLLEEAAKRDHRRIGQEQNLFMISDEIGPGLILWLPNGAVLRREIERFALDEYIRRGYKQIVTPHIANGKLFTQSGHLDFYKDSMYSPMDIDGENYYIKPMNCPMHVQIYANSPKSYRDLPLRYTEMGTVYRYERSGTLHGLTRVRGFTQDDAHIICTKEKLVSEMINVIDLTKYILETFGFKEFKVYLSIRGKKNKNKYLGSDQDWETAQEGLKQALKKSGWDYQIDEGEAVFYGPKIDIKALDAVGREWQLSTLQLDFNLPERFDMTYTDKNGRKKRPFMLHRALLGSIERFTGVLIEHYAGAFPLWLSPAQVKLVAVSAKHVAHCQKLAAKFRAKNIRVEVDSSDETVGNKIRKAITEKIPYMLVIGDKEEGSANLHVRKRGNRDTYEISKNDFITNTLKLIKERSQEL